MVEKILIVDREADIRLALENLMKKTGYEVHSVPRGDRVLDMLCTEPYDLVIMDINLPDMDGFQLIHRIKELNENTKIIILTGQISIDNVKQALRCNGAFDFLNKPLEDEVQLIASVRQALAKTSSKGKQPQAHIRYDRDRGGVSKILIVDDDIQICRMLDKILSKHGYETAVASDGFQAGTQVAEFKPDLILLDLIMPGMNGLEVCKQLKHQPNTSHIKIVAITGFDSKDNRNQFKRAGADGYLAKPISQERLFDLIEKIEIDGKNRGMALPTA